MSLRDKLKAIGNPEASEEDKIVAEAKKVWEYVKTGRRKREFQWYLDEMTYDNNQMLQFNVLTKQAQFNTNDNRAEKVVVNKAFQQVRGVVNFLNAEHPSAGVLPGDSADTAYIRAKKEKHLIDYWYRHLNLNKEAKLVSTSGAKLGLGWIKVLFDTDSLSPTKPYTMPDGSERKFQYGEVMATWVDTWEVYPDPIAKDKSKMRFMVHAVARTVAEIQANPLYKNRDKVTADGRLAASNMRQAQIRQNIANNITTQGQPNGADTVLVLEVYRKIFDQATNKWGIWVTTLTEAGTLLRHEQWKIDEFPFEAFQIEVSSTLLGSRGIIHNIREPLRARNDLLSQVQESARVMGKLNWLIPRGSNVNVITDEAGQFIEYDVTPGGAPRQATPSALPTYIMQFINMLGKEVEDLGGMHASFNGNAPFAQASGDLVDKLSEGDQNSLTLMRDNYDDFFVRTFKLMLKTAKENYKESRQIPSVLKDAFGQSRWFDIKAKDISTNDTLEVSTGSQMPYSIAQKQQMYMNLWKEKAIQDPNKLFRLLAIPDLDAANDDDDMDIERQLDEIRSVIDDNKIDDPILAENHGVHIQTLDKFMRGDEFKKLTAKQQQMLMDHRSKHIDFTIQLAQIQSAQQMEPIKRSVTAMMRLNGMHETTPIERTQLLNRLGVQSDAAQIQMRGGLYVQDPAQAERQAQAEDIEMMNHKKVQVSFADNHQVHMETHDQVIQHPSFKGLPQDIQKLFTEHMRDHINAQAATQAAPGLMPNSSISLPNQPSLNDPGYQNPGAMPTDDAQNPNPILSQELRLYHAEQQMKAQQLQEQAQFAASHGQPAPADENGVPVQAAPQAPPQMPPEQRMAPELPPAGKLKTKKGKK